MKLILHVGFPKCGSTSLQNSLFDNSGRLAETGISYMPRGSEFRNHHALAVLSRSPNTYPEFKQQLICLLDSARASGMKAVLVSSEEFVYSVESDSLANGFEAVLREAIDATSVEVEIVAIIRDPRKFFRSYMLQNAANGASIDPGFKRFFEFFIKIIRRFIDMNLPVKILSMDQVSVRDGLVPYFYKEILQYTNFEAREHIDNVLAKRTFVSEVIVGRISQMNSYLGTNHINSPQIDVERERLKSRSVAAASLPLAS